VGGDIESVTDRAALETSSPYERRPISDERRYRILPASPGSHFSSSSCSTSTIAAKDTAAFARHAAE
jgi:hypothetical protein